MNTEKRGGKALGPPTTRNVQASLLRTAIGCCILSSLTLPLVASIWLGELPVLALIQMPKIAAADWLRIHVAMDCIRFCGLSQGSFSPDYVMAGPYALAAAYMIPVIPIGFIGFRRERFLTACFLLAASVDYVLTLIFADGRSLTLY